MKRYSLWGKRLLVTMEPIKWRRLKSIFVPLFTSFQITKGLLDKFGEKRVVDTPITEMGFGGLAVGAALAGLRPMYVHINCVPFCF
jgi:hypothetical protein